MNRNKKGSGSYTMEKCCRLIFTALACLILVPALIVTGQEVCDYVVEKVEANFIDRDHLFYHTCNDYMGIQHGLFCNKKCRILGPLVENEISAVGCPVHPRFSYCEADDIFRRSAEGQYRRKKRQIASECNTENIVCSPNAIYRSIDGSCNNLANPLWGKADRGQNRLLPNAYDDGRDSPRSRGCNNTPLPSPRHVSNKVLAAEADMRFEARLSYMMMQMGQFLAHDVVLTKLITRPDGDPLLCCGEDRFINEACLPISIPQDDPYFPSGGCMNFGRSQARRDCSGVRQQINSQTSYVDLSMIYGVTDRESRSLRSLSGGKLLDVGKKLPIDYNDRSCQLTRPFHAQSYYCARSGDARVNEQPGLASLHTILMREHNRLAQGLAAVNPHWDDEKLFQEARKINIAQWQNIVYGEYIPLIIGRETMQEYNLNVAPAGYKDTYSPSVDATILNSFAVAVLRMGHSLIHRNVSMLSFNNSFKINPQPLHKNFFEPFLYHAENGYGLEYILLWTASIAAPRVDNQLEPSVQRFLFQDSRNDSFDLAALNMQRSRDHGVPSYNSFRIRCNLSPVMHFGTGPGGLVDQTPEAALKLSQAYLCTEDIDLYAGILTEQRSHGSILGPTGRCLMATQFKRLRDGDRYFFERLDPMIPGAGFTPDQLRQIKQTLLSTLLCMNTSARYLQPYIFLRPDDMGASGQNADIFGFPSPFQNRLESCTTQHGIDFNLWRENYFQYYPLVNTLHFK